MEAFKALEEAGGEAGEAARRRAELRERADQAGEDITQLSAQLEAAGAKQAHLQCACPLAAGMDLLSLGVTGCWRRTSCRLGRAACSE